ncbi:MAG: hypothetical protein U0793_27685 [Gemmataceae bacterium]
MLTQQSFRALVIGFRPVELQRLRKKACDAGLPFELGDGGHIGDGSNAARNAMAATSYVDVVFWRLEGSRVMPKLFACGVRPIRVNGVSSALQKMREIAKPVRRA